jgi:hypothetical protein
MLDIGILEDDVTEPLLKARHGGKGNVFRTLRDTGDEACILLRKESLWNDDVEIDG